MGVSIIDFMSGATFAFGVVSAILSARATGEAKLATPDYKVEIIITAAVA